MRVLKVHYTEDGVFTLCGRRVETVEGRLARTKRGITCGFCLRALAFRKMPKAHDRPNYYNDHRAKCIAEGRCHKCSNELYKWGMCQKHYRACKQRRPEKKPRRTNGKRAFDCSQCGGEGHSVLTCQN